MIIEVVLAALFAAVGFMLTVRMIGNDEHYGQIGLGSMTMSAANAFSSAPLPGIIEPDLIIKTGTGKRRVLDIDIDDVLVWDCRRWDVRVGTGIDLAGGESTLQQLEGGITKDNTSRTDDGPTADSVAEGTNPSGRGASVTGTAGLGTTVMNGEDVPRFEQYWDFGLFGNEENAAGEINNGAFSTKPKNSNLNYSPYQVDGITVHKLLTAAHYWLWGDSAAMTAAITFHLGADVRRMSINVEELMFDREVLLSILDALVLSN